MTLQSPGNPDPANRDSWTFAELLYWHFLVYGTRPDGDPDADAGRIWTRKKAAHAVGHSPRQFANWLNGTSAPLEPTAIEQALFGDSPRFDKQRNELRAKLAIARARIHAERSGATAVPSGKHDVENSLTPSDVSPPETSAVENLGNDFSQPATDDDNRMAPDDVERAWDYLKAKSSYLYTAEARVDYASSPAASKPADSPRRLKARRWLGAVAVAAAAAVTLIVTRSTNDLPRPVAMAPVQPPGSGGSGGTPPQPPQTLLPTPLQPPAVPHDGNPPAAPPQPQQAENKPMEVEATRVRLAAFEAGRRQQDQKAIQLDQKDQRRVEAQLQADRDEDARRAAAFGFTLRENSSFTGQNMQNTFVDTLIECITLCESDNTCAGFDFMRTGPQPAACRRFMGPLKLSPDPNFVSGIRMVQPKPGLATPLTMPGDATEGPDGILRCANGPFKVTGFKLGCDRMMAGGVVIPNTQLRYSVANINECAAKCRPVRDCIGFSFNAAEFGPFTCQIFGQSAQVSTVNGWVSGQIDR